MTLYINRGSQVTVIKRTIFLPLLVTALFILLSVLSLPAEAALGDFLYKWGSGYNLETPLRIAVDSSGNVYLADPENNRVHVFSNTGTLLGDWGSPGSGDGQFNYPWGIAVDTSGNVYVADTNNHRIQVFNNTGTFLTKWGLYGTGDGQLNYPYGIAVDGNGSVYVADSYNNRIQVFSNTGTFLKKWGVNGSGDGQFSHPYGIAVDGNGNVYVADTGNNRVQVFNNAGSFLRKWGSNTGSYWSFPFQLFSPYGIAVDSSGNVYVADTWDQSIKIYSSTGTFKRAWGGPPGVQDYSNAFHGIAVDSNGNVYATNTTHLVRIFSNTGTLLRKWATSDLGYNQIIGPLGDGQFNRPRGIARDSSGNVYVVDTSNSRIQVFSKTGAFLRKWGYWGTNEGQFYGAVGIAVDNNGNVYVSESNYQHARVQVFSSTGVFLRKFGSYGSGDGQFYSPMGISVDENGKVYVVDYGNYRVQVFSNIGTFLYKFGSRGYDDGQFQQLSGGIAVNGNGDVYVAESDNGSLDHSVQVFSNTGTFLRKWGSLGSNDGQFSGPGHIALDERGNVYVADSFNRRVQVFSSTGTFLGKWGTYGSSDGQFVFPIGINVDSSGKVYVVDNVNGRVQVFDGRLTDTQMPVTTYTISGSPGDNEWYISNVGISLTATDSDSGVKEIHYSIDGAETVVAGSSASFTISADGEHSVSYYAVDNAGNIETAHPLTIKIDKTAPTVTALSSPTPNAAGWNNTNVTVTFTCNDAMSGIESCQAPIEVVSEGAGQVISGTVKDFAGLTATASATVNIDKTVPVITASVGPAPNVYGWNNTDVTVTFTCSDTLSGIASCPAPINVTNEGDGQVITGTAVDIAGNTATASVMLNIDKTPPSIPSLSTNPGMLWPPNHKMVDVLIIGSAADYGSDVASIVISVTDEYGVYNMTGLSFGSTIQLEAWREGTDRDGRHYTITAVVTDKAGNRFSASTTVLVPHDIR